VLGHALAVQSLRAACPGKAPPVGLAENVPNVVPVLDAPQHVAAARAALREMSGMYLTPIFEGTYHPNYLREQGADAPTFTDDEMRAIATPLDFLGINLYAPTYVRADPAEERGWSIVPCDASYPRMHMPWLTIGPSILYWGPRLAREAWNLRLPLYVTENGCASPDEVNERGEVVDTARVMYLQEHLIHAHRAAAEGLLQGYFLWSLLDNFEWAFAYTRRFGIHYVDFETQRRIPKLSARFYADVIRRNALG
jgi:beta-glucosidase